MSILRALILIPFFLVLALLHLTFSTRRINLEYQIEQITEEKTDWEGKNELLRYEVAAQEALPRIERFAKEKQAMVKIEKPLFYLVGEALQKKKALEKQNP